MSASYVELANPPTKNAVRRLQEIAAAAGGGQYIQFTKSFLQATDSAGLNPVLEAGETIGWSWNGLQNAIASPKQTSSANRPVWGEDGALFAFSATKYLDLQRPWPTNFTMFLRATVTDNGVLIGVNRQTPNQRMMLFTSSGVPNWRIGTGAASNANIAFGTGIIGEDVLIAVRWTGAVLTFFVNGVNVGTNTPTSPVPNTVDNVWLGRGNYPDGTPPATPGVTMHSLFIVDDDISDDLILEVSNLIGWTTSTTIPLTMESSITFPTVSGSSPARSPVCTGLDFLADGRGVIGDDGRYAENDPVLRGGVIIYNSTFTTQLNHFTWVDLGIGANYSCQGVVVDTDDDTIYAIAKNTESDGSSLILQINPTTGTLIRSLEVTRAANGLAIDNDNDQFLLLVGNSFRRLAKADAVQVGDAYSIPGLSGPDMIYYLGANKMLLTHGANRQDGMVDRYDISTATPVREERFRLIGCQAIEGITIKSGKARVNSDQGFHPGTDPATRFNQVQQFDATSLLS